MKKFELLFSMLILFSQLAMGQITNDYRSATSGNWSTFTTWQRYNGTAWITPTGGEGVPSSTSGVITILSGHTVSIPNVNQTADQMTINSGGQVTINTGRTLTIANGTGTDLTVNGTLVNSGTLTFSTGVTATFGNGSIYQHNKDGGIIPAATWNTNSTCSITGITGNLPTGLEQSFGHLIWNCQSQTVASTPAATYNIQGNLTVQSTGTGQFRMGTGTTSNNNVLGNYLQSGGTVRISGATARTLNVGGNFNLSGGTFLMSEAATLGTLNIAGNFTHSAGTITQTLTGGSGTIIFNGTSNQLYTGGGTISNTINFTINNSAGITLLTSVIFPVGLTMTSGNIALNGNTLTLGTSTTNTGTLSWTNGFIVGSGSFTRWYSTASITIGNVLGLFPMGNGTDPRSVWIGGTPLTGGTVSVQHTNATGATALSFVENSQTFLSRINANWVISTAGGFAGTSLLLRIQGSGIQSNSLSDLNICLSVGAAGGNYSAPTGSLNNTQVNRTGLTQITLANTFYIASIDAALPVELTSFSATTIVSTVKLSWHTATEVNNYGFEVERQAYSSTPLSVTGWEKIGFVNGNGNSNSPKSYSYVDNKISSGKYSYRLKQIDNDGQFEYSKIINVDFKEVKKFELSQNYPNPFNPTTTIRFNLPEAGNVKLTLFNILGQELITLVNEFKESGVHTINFSALDGDSRELNSGIYIYKLEANGFVQTRKMTLVK